MIQKAFIRLQDWIDEKLRHLCGRMSPEVRLTVILILITVSSGLSVYFVVSSIYRMGKEEGENNMQIEHIRQLELHRNDSIHSLNQYDNGRKREE